MDCLKTVFGIAGATVLLMILLAIGAILAPFAVIYLMITEWRDVEEDDNDEMYNAR